MRLLTSLHFPSATGFHRFNYPMLRPVEQSFIELIAIRLVTKTGENVVLKIAIFRALLYYTLKRSPQRNKSQFVSYNGSI